MVPRWQLAPVSQVVMAEIYSHLFRAGLLHWAAELVGTLLDWGRLVGTVGQYTVLSSTTNVFQGMHCGVSWGPHPAGEAPS